MGVFRKILILLFAALMASSPLVAQAAERLHDVTTVASLSSVAADQHCADSVDADSDDADKGCASCCLAHTVALPLLNPIASSNPPVKLAQIKLLRDWAGAIRLAPDTLLRPPRA